MTDTLGAFLDTVCARDPQREAVACAPSDRVTQRSTWHELREASRQAAGRLVAAGVGKGTRVALLAPNGPEWLPIAFGVFRVGAVLVPLSTLWTRDELAFALAHADVQVLICRSGFRKHDYLGRLAALLPELATAVPGRLYAAAAPALRQVLVLGGESVSGGLARWDDLPADVPETVLDGLERAVSPTDLATIFFTSGTTARPKAVMHAHAALVLSGRRIAECLGIAVDDAWWGHMPLFWSGGFVIGALATMAGGGRLVLQERVDPAAALALLEAERCTIMAGWHQAAPLLEHPDFARRQLWLRKGSYHALAERLLGPGHRAVGMYGMSETATCVSAARFDDPPEIRQGTFGRPLPGMELRIADPESGRPLPAGAVGEILVRGATLMEGYYRVPRSHTFDAEGFFHTGDLGFLDAGGHLHFTGRLKDVIKTAGVNVAAIEIEETLTCHPAVRHAYVVGVPDPGRGENVAAFVVLAPGAEASSDALLGFCRERLASYKVPRHLFVIDAEAVPWTASGKVEKGALRRLALDRLAAGDRSPHAASERRG